MIPLTPANSCKILNLKEDRAIVAMFEQHQALVMLKIEEWLTPESFDLSKTEESPVCFNFAYAFLMLNSCIDFLNIKTSGSGIVKSTGFDSQRVDLLNQSDTKSMKFDLIKRALILMKKHLNTAGLTKLYSLTPKRLKPVRMAII